MAVPPIKAAGFAGPGRVHRPPLVLDVIVGLLTVVALPLATVAIPNTISVVSALLPPQIAGVGILRAHGLALPVMLCVVPLAGAALRRLPAAPILVAGLGLLAAADVAGGFAGSSFAVGALRVLHGAGAGLLVPATFAACARRSGAARSLLMAVWGAALAASLLAAQALALWPLDEAMSWRVTLQPYPLLTGVALALAAVHLLLARRAGGDVRPSGGGAPRAARSAADAPDVTPGPDPSADGEGQGTGVAPDEHGRLLFAAGPSAGIAVLAFGTTFDWPPGLIVAAAALAVVMLLVMAFAGRVGGPGGRVLACVMVAVGLVVLPTAAQITYIELGGLGGPGLTGLWVPFGLAVLIALAAAVTAGTLGEAWVPKLVAGGLLSMVAGLCAIRLLVPVASGMPLLVPFALLAAGAAVAVTAAARRAGLAVALFGLSLCFPAVLSGFLLGTGIQVGRLREVGTSGQVTSQAMVDGFVGALHVWAFVAGFAVVVVLALVSVSVVQGAERAPHPDGTSSSDAEPSPGAGPETAMVPVVPAPTRSPEVAYREGGDGSGAR